MAERSLTELIYDASGVIDSTGSANAYVLVTAQPISGYYRGMPPIRFKANFANTGAATANVSGLGAIALKKLGGAADVGAGDIVSGGVYTLIYDGTNFQITELNIGVISSTSLADNAVTNAKLDNMAQQTIKARKTLSTGYPEDCTLSEVMDFIGSAVQGDILYRGASTWVRLAAGTANRRLLTGGASANPSWGGGLVTIASGNLPAAANLDIINIPQIYSYLILDVSGISHNSGSNQTPLVRASNDNGSTFSTVGYRNSAVNTYGGTTLTAPASDTMVSDIAARAASQAWNYTICIFGYNGAQYIRYVSALDVVGVTHLLMDGTLLLANLNALRILFSGGNIDAGSYILYGVL